jgi:hypothetical protein
MIKDGGSPMPEDNEKISPVKAAVILALLLLVIVGTVRLLQKDDAPTPSTKNRVPVQMIDGQQLVNLQQQVKDQQAQLDALKTQQAATSKVAFSCPEPNVKCGPNETTLPGIITDFGAYDLLSDSQTSDVYSGFTFTDRTGFSKRFYPVCPGQTIKTDVPITILYHWRNWEMNSTGKRGCYVIDGFQGDLR